MLKRLTKIEREIREIKERNARVEADKAGEISTTRKAIIFAATYASLALLLFAAGSPDPLLGATIPAAAFVLSTMTLGFAKERWLRKK